MSDSFGNNKYTFIWEITNLKYKMLSCFDSNDIRSPMFTTEHIGGASWFLAIHRMSESHTDKLQCLLVRHSEDKGSEIVRIQYLVKFTSNHTSDKGNRKYLSEVFKRGDSCLGCELYLEIPNCSELFPITLQCIVIDYSIVKTPICKCIKVETKAEYFIWKSENQYQQKTFCVFHGVKYIVTVNRGSYSDNVDISIRRSDTENLEVYLMYSVLVCNGFSEKQINRENIGWSKPFEIDEECSVTPGIKWPPCRGSRICSKLDILFVTSVLKDSECSIFEEKPALQTNTSDIVSDLRRMYENKMHTDLKLITGSQTFPAHKAILSCRSAVFAAMFHQKDMAESQSGVVDITDVDGETLNLLLKYMYTNDIDKLHYDNALTLLIAADKYQVLSLKGKCATYLLDNLSDDNVCEVLVAADMISYSDLKSIVMNYVNAHAEKIFLSDSWKQLVKKNSNLVAETLSMIFEDFGIILSQYNVLKKNRCSTFKETPALQTDTSNIFSHVLRQVYENKLHPDVKLTTGNQTFPAHKCILSCRSPVFAAMFDQKGMAEAQSGVVDIKDVDGATLDLLLKYLYTNDVDQLPYESALSLLIAAEKYQVSSLKEKCGTDLLNALSEENVCEVLLISDMISYNDLKISATDYVRTRADKIFNSDNWKQLVKKNSNLGAETLSVVSEDFAMILSEYIAGKTRTENPEQN